MTASLYLTDYICNVFSKLKLDAKDWLHTFQTYEFYAIQMRACTQLKKAYKVYWKQLYMEWTQYISINKTAVFPLILHKPIRVHNLFQIKAWRLHLEQQVFCWSDPSLMCKACASCPFSATPGNSYTEAHCTMQRKSLHLKLDEKHSLTSSTVANVLPFFHGGETFASLWTQTAWIRCKHKIKR